MQLIYVLKPVINFKRATLFLGRDSDRVSLAQLFKAGTIRASGASRVSDG
jgi:hypothetical protein